MSNLSTDDCKDYLMQVYPNSARTKWKRVSKYKDANGLICRDFNNPSVGDVTLVEVDESLQLKKNQALIQEPLVTQDNTVVVKSFSKKDMTDAKRLVSRYVNNYGEYDISDEHKGFNAIPSQVVYRFSILDGDYKILLDDINTTGDYNSKLDRFCLEIYPKDSEYNEHMDGLISDFLPENDGEAMECTYEFSYEEPITIKEMVQKMASAGFIYLSNHCFLETTINKLNFVNEPLEITSTTAIDIKSVFEQAIKTDDAILLEEALAAGALVDFKYKKVTALIYCMQNNHVNCFKVLVKYTKDLAKGVKSDGNPIWRLSASPEISKYNFDYLTHLLEYGHYDFNKARVEDNKAAMSALVKRSIS